MTLALAAAPAAWPAHSHRYLVEQQLHHGLAGTPLAPYAFTIEAQAFRQNINPFLIAAIAGTESTFGEAACGGNAWGIGSCSMSFPTFGAGAAYEARLLRDDYVGEGLSDVWAIGTKYCRVCGSQWGDTTALFMRSRFGSNPSSVTYPTN